MRRYFFRTSDGREIVDEHGVELLNTAAAGIIAFNTAAELATQSDHPSEVVVADDRGVMVMSVPVPTIERFGLGGVIPKAIHPREVITMDKDRVKGMAHQVK